MSIENQLGLKYPIYWNGWAIEEQFARLLIYKIIANRPKIIVELGSGISTLIGVKTLSKLGYDFSYYSFDSDELFLNETKNLLISEGLYDKKSVNLIHSETEKLKINESEYIWYKCDDFKFEFDRIDLMIVDGPVGSLCKNARYPAIPVMRKYLKKGSIALLDDADRNDEKKIVEMWQKETPLVSKILRTETGRGAVEIRF